MTKNKKQKTNLASLFIIGSLLALAIGGGFGAWVYHSTVALQLTAPGLAEYVKFLAEVRLGTLAIQRLYFLLPLAVCSLSMPILVVNKQLKIHWILATLIRLMNIPLALALLSPVWSPTVLLNNEFRLQTIIAMAAIGLLIIAPIFNKLSLKWLLLCVSSGTLIATSLALRQFYLVNEAVAATYAQPVKLGWGGWLTIIGTVGLLICTVYFWKKAD